MAPNPSMEEALEATRQLVNDAMQRGIDIGVGVAERIVRANLRADQPGVKIGRSTSGSMTIDVHAYVGVTQDQMMEVGKIARAEYDRQNSLVSLPQSEVEELRWLASIGMVVRDRMAQHGTTLTYDEVQAMLAPNGDSGEQHAEE